MSLGPHPWAEDREAYIAARYPNRAVVAEVTLGGVVESSEPFSGTGFWALGAPEPVPESLSPEPKLERGEEQLPDFLAGDFRGKVAQLRQLVVHGLGECGVRGTNRDEAFHLRPPQGVDDESHDDVAGEVSDHAAARVSWRSVGPVGLDLSLNLNVGEDFAHTRGRPFTKSGTNVAVFGDGQKRERLGIRV